VSLSRSLIGRRRSTANVFVTVRSASRSSTADHHAVVTASRVAYFDLSGHGHHAQGPYRPPKLSPGRMTFSASARSQRWGGSGRGGLVEADVRLTHDVVASLGA
jgi:hypothetical protein